MRSLKSKFGDIVFHLLNFLDFPQFPVLTRFLYLCKVWMCYSKRIRFNRAGSVFEK